VASNSLSRHTKSSIDDPSSLHPGRAIRTRPPGPWTHRRRQSPTRARPRGSYRRKVACLLTILCHAAKYRCYAVIISDYYGIPAYIWLLKLPLQET